MTENTESKPKVSSSPERDTFQKQKYIERKAKLGEEPSDDYLEMFETLKVNKKNKMRDPAWCVDNMEYDLRTTDWILDKVRNSDTYAQNLYAAMCNNGFIKNDVWPILTEKEWGCSWRYAGGIIADMRESGDYIDWYCSGIGDGLGNGDIDSNKNYVPEGQITDEIKEDLLKLGWIIAPGGDNELSK
jgi:hypothetical protein